MLPGSLVACNHQVLRTVWLRIQEKIIWALGWSDFQAVVPGPLWGKLKEAWLKCAAAIACFDLESVAWLNAVQEDVYYADKIETHLSPLSTNHPLVGSNLLGGDVHF